MRRITAAFVALMIMLAGLVATSSSADAQSKGKTIKSPCPKSARVCLNLTTNRTWMQDKHGKVIWGPVKITSGRNGYRTPRGTFHVTHKDKNHWSSDFDWPMPYSVFFNGGIAFHKGSLHVQSHGCIHLGITSAKFYYKHLHVGDKVFVYGRRK